MNPDPSIDVSALSKPYALDTQKFHKPVVLWNYRAGFELATPSRCRKGFKNQEISAIPVDFNFWGNVERVMKDVKVNKGGLNSEIQSRIGHQLRAMYDDVVRQGVPDRFAELIKKLDAPDASVAANDLNAGHPAAAKAEGRD